MFFTEGRKYTLITQEQADKLVKQEVLHMTSTQAYVHDEYTAFMHTKMFGRSFIANNTTNELRNQSMEEFESCYTIYPWMCKEYYISLMETE